jgi:hemoglobin
VALALVSSMFAAAPVAAAPPPAKSLYERLGGQGAVDAVIHEFVARITTDPRIAARFANSDPAAVTKRLTEFVCLASGGPCKYGGRDMHEAHADMGIIAEEFDALVEDLVGALDKFHVPGREKGELLGALGPLKGEIVVASPPPETRPGMLARLDEVKRRAEELRRRAGAPGVGGERAALLKKIALLLDSAATARRRGQRSYADQLLTFVELQLGKDDTAIADLGPVFREGAPERVTSPLRKFAMDTAPQPARAVGSSDEDQPDAKPKRGALRGTVSLDGKPLGGAFAVVTLEPASGHFARREPKQRVMEQRNRQFAPRILAVPLGSTVAFPNFDPVYHNVFSRSESAGFDLGVYRNGDSRDYRFDKEGVVRLGCNLHANMSAYILVVAAPHYAIVDEAGGFSFRSLEPGRYKMKVWSERSAEPVARALEVKPGSNRATVDVKADAKVAGVSLDKFGAPRGKTR